MEQTKIAILDKGPYLVQGKITLVNKEGVSEEKEGNIALCRCGLSVNKPFCDGAHKGSDVLDR
ncbi:MAG: CDGSH iron-sulfur domain-containing protein [Bacteroidetes bacterium]|nr:CDGSH iron-sulfur domain-containing protein [Bacteroidota bacterium]